MSHTFAHGNTRIHYNSDYSGEATILVAQEGCANELKVPAADLVAFACQVVSEHLEKLAEGLPQRNLLWKALDVCHSGTETLGYLRADNQGEAYQKAVERFGEKHDTDGAESLAVRLATPR